MEPLKFQIGQKVRVIADGEEGIVLSVSMDESGVFYKVSSKEVDLQKKEVINGVKTVTQDELMLVADEVAPEAPVAPENPAGEGAVS